MYQDDYKRWMEADLEDADLKPELTRIEGNDEEIKERFAVALKFGTAGLRGVLGAGTNRMNIYVVRQATQGLANWVKTQGGTQTVAISYDSRLKSDVFAKNAAGVLAANGIKVRIYDALMPVPALSFATRYYNCNAGVMVTASHNPAKYNGYKAYGPDGCQMTDDAAAIVYEEIQKTDVLTGAKYMSFAQGVEEGLIRFVGDDCKRALYDAIESRQVRPGLCRTAGLKLVYSPLNGSGLVPVTQILKDIGVTDITIVPEQEYPNGYFTTCSYPNPEIFDALEKGLELAKETGADLMLATDPDADRVGIAMKCPDGSYELVSGNEVGVLLLDYICAGRIEKGTMPADPVAVKSIVSTPLADAVAEHYGVELRSVLTGFKWIGDQIAQLEAAGEVDRFIFGFEESYGYLAGPYVRDKDAVIGSMLICEMAAYYRSIGSSLKQRMEEIYAQYERHGQDGRHHAGTAGQPAAGDRRLQGCVRDRLHEAGGDRTSRGERADLQAGEQRDSDRAPLRHRAKDQDLLHDRRKRSGGRAGREGQACGGHEAGDGIAREEEKKAIFAAIVVQRKIESSQTFCDEKEIVANCLR